MKKNLLLTILTLVISLLFIQCGRRDNTNSNSTEEDMTEVSSEEEYDLGEEVTEETLTRAVNKAIEKGDYSRGYSIVEPYFEQHQLTNLRNTSYHLNEKILRSEIADLVGTDNNGDNAAKILFAIQERAKYNDFRTNHSRNKEIQEQNKMLENAIDLATAAGNDVLAERLKKSIKEVDDSWWGDLI